MANAKKLPPVDGTWAVFSDEVLTPSKVTSSKGHLANVVIVDGRNYPGGQAAYSDAKRFKGDNADDILKSAESMEHRVIHYVRPKSSK